MMGQGGAPFKEFSICGYMVTAPAPHILIRVTGEQDSETSLEIAGLSGGISFMILLFEFDLSNLTVSGFQERYNTRLLDCLVVYNSTFSVE